ncbi:MAG TPA: tetratricopeptide repeat protein [Tepidisphaeraceae bacterium]|jgi:predicted O-linked N-acetylglucosamine transferase (SPINDLY family)
MNLTDAIRLEGEGRLAEAETICRQVLGVEPSRPDALHLLGTILYEKGEFEQAVEIIRRAVQVAPANPALRVNLAALLGRMGRHEEALEHLNVAHRLNPNVPDLHNNLGLVLEALARHDDAAAAFSTAIRLRPNYPEAHFNLGNTYRKLGRTTDAAGEYTEAIRLRPDYVKSHDALASVAVELGELDLALSCYRKLLELKPDQASFRSSLLYTIHYSPDYDAAALYREHREWGRRFCDPLLDQIPPHENDRVPDRRLRIGYVSPDFREQTVPRFIGAALEHHDHNAFEIFCYSDVAKPDLTTRRLRSLPDHWKETAGKSDEAVDRLIRDDGIDILVDLRGHASRNRMKLFARKPAPVQVNMVGYFNTTGLATMDWRITDEHQDPPGLTEQYHTEQLARIPHTCWCYTADADAPEVREPPMLAKGHVTFGSLNKIVKISDPCAKLWTDVLNAVPGSRLLLSVGELTAAIRDHLGKKGLPLDRLTLVGKVKHRRHYLERFNEIDIALDTYPFNGITTTCDGLWMGVPLVSLAGTTTISRSGKSILHGLGMPELIAESPEQFVGISAKLAADPAGLRAMRQAMRQRMASSRLMDHAGFTARLEAVYRRMWRNHVLGG